jgi:uncharacterized protein YaiI (UPF0178 family)
MQILVDADALPNAVKDILFRAVKRLGIALTMVANQPMTLEKSKYIKSIIVSSGPDVADDRIVELVKAGDLVITADIPLADRVVTKGAYALDPRGGLYTEKNVKDRLAMRNLLNELRGGGVIEGGPPGFSRKDRQAFADQLNRFLTKHCKDG